MNGFVAFTFSMTGAVASMAAASCWLWRSPHSRLARRCLIALALFYTFASTYALPAAMSRVLSYGEYDYGPFAAEGAPGAPIALVVLGSGNQIIEGWDGRIDLMTDIAAARVLEAARVYHLLEPAVVVSSGGLPPGDDHSLPSGLNMKSELVRLGVPEARILVEAESASTHEEAAIVTPMLRARGIDRLVLVTSDTHMRRALGAFRAYGWDPVPAIAPDPEFAGSWGNWLIPSEEGLELSRQVARELLGLPYYWARGWWR
ncbi:MAG: YdcF family protein [Acidobacteria bacterium]|nr:YdcF family protein [Acidobacteriota bacterium]